MNKSILASGLIGSLLFVGGCAGPANPPKADDRSLHLTQLNDDDWVDLRDVKEIVFVRSDAASVAAGAEPFSIALWHRGATDNPFKFTFADEASAYGAWKRLVAQLGGSLRDEDWTPSTRPIVQQGPPVASPTLFQQQQQVTQYSIFRDDLAVLAACRDEKMITAQEYQRAHDQKVADFVTSAGNGNGYQATFGRLHDDLLQLEAARKDHLLSEKDLDAMHDKIVSRYIPAPE